MLEHPRLAKDFGLQTTAPHRSRTIFYGHFDNRLLATAVKRNCFLIGLLGTVGSVTKEAFFGLRALSKSLTWRRA